MSCVLHEVLLLLRTHSDHAVEEMTASDDLLIRSGSEVSES